MSKKLIAVASAAALALTALVGVAPASANYTFGVTATGQIGAGAGNNATDPLSINVPSQNVLRYNVLSDDEPHDATTAATLSVIRLEVQATTTSAAVRAVSTGGIEILTQAQWDAATKTTATGTQSVDVTSSSTTGKVAVYVYTTSTAVGTVTVTQGSNSKVVHVKGRNILGYAYNVNFTAPATADVSGDILLTGTITDVFGNRIVGLGTSAATNLTLSAFGSATTTEGTGTKAWTESATDSGLYTFALSTTATAGQGAIGIAAKTAPVSIAALGAPKAPQFLTFSTASLADQIKTLQASIATLQASVTALTADYNKLANRWNKLQAAKKAPKKKVATK